MKALLAAACAALALPCCLAGQMPAAAGPEQPVITVGFSDPGLSPSRWTLTLHPDGSGHFTSTMGTASGGEPAGQMRIPDVSRDVQLSPKFAAGAFEVAQREQWFNEKCESHLKVAFQGWKTLSYAGPAGNGSCTFNYSSDKDVQALGDSFMAVSETILEGVRLEMLLEHDPLGLDQEIETLAAAARDGSAQELCAIRGILERLAQDDGVMEMVRKRARSLLAHAQS